MPLFAPSSLRVRVLRPILGCALVVTCAMPASAQMARDAIDASKPFAAWSNSVHDFRDSLVSMARAQVGTKYVRGGQSPQSGFDCSGLVRYVMGVVRVKLPRTAAEQAVAGAPVDRDTMSLQPGDLLTFGKGKRGASHIGIYVGNGRFVHASSVAGHVIESAIARPHSPLIKPWRGARRVLTGNEPTDTTVASIGGDG
jgi:cell wall-associated NlpC family hydrolase